MKFRFLIFGLLLGVPAFAANHFVRDGGSGDGSAWNNAFDDLPVTLTRGDTYYVADGIYASYTFDDAASGATVTTIKKATASDHGTETGWVSTYGDGQAVFTNSIRFETPNWVFDGNGTNTLPSNTASDYGFKIDQSSLVNWAGQVQFAGCTNVAVRYVHVYNAYNGSVNPDEIAVRWSASPTHTKLQNCWIQNSGRDGLQIVGANYVLVERCYLERLGKRDAESPDNHGQTIYGAGSFNVVVRYNTFQDCEGQALWAVDDAISGNLRFYGNLIFNSTTNTARGFNSSGGIFQSPASPAQSSTNIFIYNNTLVRVGSNSTAYAHHVNYGSYSVSNYVYNTLEYGCTNTGISGTWAGAGYWATGNGNAPGQSNEQTGVVSAIFNNYSGYDFTLASNTSAGLTLSAQNWWSGGADGFFGAKDSDVDMAGNTRTTWSRGAYEYASGGGGGDVTAPTCAITSPASVSSGGSGSYSTSSSTITVSGTSDDATATITWSNSRGGAGTATGSTSWSQAGITLASGGNVLTFTATDPSANFTTTTLNVTYTVPAVGGTTNNVGTLRIY